MHKIFISIITLLLGLPLFAQNLTEKFNDAMNAYNNQLYSEAYKIFDEVIKDYDVEDELYSVARFYAANSLLKMGKKDESTSGFEYIVNSIVWSKFREESLFKLGLIYYDLNRFALSRKNHLMLIYQYPNSEYLGSSMYWIGESYSAEGKLDDAIEFLTQAIEDKSANRYRDHSIYALASIYEKKHDYQNAVKYYDQLLTYHSNSSLALEAQVRIGVCYFYLKDYYNSILELNNPDIQKLPTENLSEALYLLANSHYRVEEYSDAANTYSEVIKRFPNSDIYRNSQYGLAWSLFQQSKYGEAYQVFNTLSEGYDSIAIKSFIWKGESKRYAGQTNEALAIFQNFLVKYPDDPSTTLVENLIGLIYFDQNKFEQSTQYLTNATSSEDPLTRAKAFTMIGEIELQNKNYIKARGNFDPAVRISSEESEVHLRALLGLGVSLFHLGDYNEAVENFRQAETIDPAFEQDKINFYMAESYYSLGKYQEALSRYNNIKSTEIEYVRQVTYSKGYCQFNLGNYSNAAYLFSEFIQNYPDDFRMTDAKLRLADSYFGSKNFAAASKIFKEVFKSGKFSSDDPYTYFQYAQALYKSGESNAAIDEFRNLQKKFPDSKYGESSLFTIGFIRFQEGEFEEAINDYRMVMQIYKKSSLTPAVYYSIGDAYFNLGEYDSAIVNYRNVLAKYPSSEYAYDAINGMQYSYVAAGRSNEAINLIDRYVSQNPNLKFSDQIYFKKGEIYYSQRDYENAKLSYQEFLVKYPKSSFVPEAYYWLGKSSQNLKQDDEAIFYFSKVFDNYPGSESAAVSVIELGKMYEAKGNYQAGIDVLERASSKLKDSPRLPEVLFLKGSAYIKVDDVQKAYATFEELAMYHPETVFADRGKIEMGLIDLAISRFNEADKNFLDVAGRRTDDLGAKAQYQYGVSLFEQGKYSEAVSALVRVRTVFSQYEPWISRSYLLMGDCYVKMNDKRQAEEMYRVVVTKHKGNELGEEARQKINKLK
ncbi:MAG: tetratricopeptide repeat protein [Ignavibacteriota bacterium]|nr:tetratricopeptide repeat protein [Ignavibacteriales bacterium]MCC7094084.1 tetratricopeptide repeat protein [Ignavibacteriaceae bacterium]MEB2295415.1 tetratricopeptide repeat protein [Ignavibacteria bacterium]NUM60765.1 tetratricopeptide repeat protein [Ignavibacteriaceae bacterium]QKJ97211.1 MAG: tetratricopeptide repeat protein [Ignavibacteriota bacterium]